MRRPEIAREIEKRRLTRKQSRRSGLEPRSQANELVVRKEEYGGPATSSLDRFTERRGALAPTRWVRFPSPTQRVSQADSGYTHT